MILRKFKQLIAQYLSWGNKSCDSKTDSFVYSEDYKGGVSSHSSYHGVNIKNYHLIWVENKRNKKGMQDLNVRALIQVGWTVAVNGRQLVALQKGCHK